MRFDYIIIGSGFGGSVSELYVFQKGYKAPSNRKRKYKANDFED
jgi:cholesterol oxidase